MEVPQLLANIGNVLQALLGGITGPEDLQEAVEAEARAIVGAAAVPIVGEEEARVGWQPEELSFRPVPGEQAELGGASWQSLVRGTGTIETDFLNGEITLIARRLGRVAPINTRLTALARRAAGDGLTPGSIDVSGCRCRLPTADRDPRVPEPFHERIAAMSSPLVSAPITADLLDGALELETTAMGVLPHRLPARARALADPQLLGAEACPAGVRLVFRTAATVVEVDGFRTTMAFLGMPPRPDGRYDLVVDGVLTDRQCSSGGRAVVVDLATGATETHDGPVGTVRFADLPARDKDVEIWLPYHERTELVDLRADAPVAAVPPRGRPVWVHHGSSISQGSNAASPTTTWPALAAAAGRVDLVNLGFAGSMMLDSGPLYGEADAADHPLPDRLHPDAVTHRIIGERFAAHAFGPAGHFSTAPR